MTHIKPITVRLSFFSVQQAGRECLRRQLEIDDLSIPDRIYPIPKYVKPKPKYEWTPAGAVGFITNYGRMLIP